jgi:MFS family permease
VAIIVDHPTTPDAADLPGSSGQDSQKSTRFSLFSALHHRNFRLFWFGQIISVTGTWMQSIGQAWLVLQLTHNAFLLGVVSALQFLPVLLLSPFGGVIADKFPKRRLLICTQAAAMAQAAVMFVLAGTGTIRVWQIFILAACLGTVNALDIPTRQAFISEMVGRGDLMNAISLNSAQFNASRVVGPGIAGLLIALLGIPPLFLLNAISYIAVIAGLALMNPALLQARVNRGTPPQRALAQVREGMIFSWRSPSIRLALVMLFAISTFGMNFNIILPLLAENTYHIGAPGFGLLSSVLGAGSLISALVLAATVKRPRMGLLVVSAFGFGILEFLLAGARTPQLAVVALVFLGFASIAFSATANTMLQTNSPDHMRGRVMSLFAMVFAGATPIGALLTGTVAHLFNAQVALAVGATPCLAVAIYAWFMIRSTARGPRAPTVTVTPELELAASMPPAGQIKA